MNIQVQATYRAGVIYPDDPIALPENTRLELSINAVKNHNGLSPRMRPPAPRMSVEELRDRVRRYAVHVGSLPVDFSREDIYQDHD